MLIGSWPLDLFWILSLVIIGFAASAYTAGEMADRYSRRRRDDASGPRIMNPGGGADHE